MTWTHISKHTRTQATCVTAHTAHSPRYLLICTHTQRCRARVLTMSRNAHPLVRARDVSVSLLKCTSTHAAVLIKISMHRAPAPSIMCTESQLSLCSYTLTVHSLLAGCCLPCGAVSLQILVCVLFLGYYSEILKSSASI